MNHDNHDFPFIETYPDCAGKKRKFKIECVELPGPGWVVTALEVKRSESEYGYEIKAFSETNPYSALGKVRDKIRKNLAIKYLDLSSDHLSLTHDVMKGVIVYDRETGGCGLLVDGEFLSLRDFAQIIDMYEGWEFQMRISDEIE